MSRKFERPSRPGKRAAFPYMPPSRSGDERKAVENDAATAQDPNPRHVRGRAAYKDPWHCKQSPEKVKVHVKQLVIFTFMGRGCHWYASRRWVTDKPAKPLPRGVPVPRNYRRGTGHWEDLEPEWLCRHEWVCKHCGKRMGKLAEGECPLLLQG
jgi:hypothetical protein